MIYIKLFDTGNNYLAYRNEKYLKPNVSYSKGNEMVYYNYPTPIVYSYVDLGLSSGTKWATTNVGAINPSDAGLYFQWGDIVGYTADQVGTGDGQKFFSSGYSDYKWFSGNAFTKYTTTGETLALEDDAAHFSMGNDWHMPTPTPTLFKELINETTTAWTTSNGVSGMTFTSKKDASKYIFIPAVGDALNGSVNGSGSYGQVRSSMLSTSNVYDGQFLSISSTGASLSPYTRGRYRGFSVRGVIG